MQSWCPEPFDLAADTEVVQDAQAAADFAEEALATPADDDAESHRFRREAGFNDPGTILNHMSQQERGVVFELVEMDVAAAYEEREQALRAELETRHAEALNELRAATRAWSEEFANHRDTELREMAAASARLAVELASRVVRCHLRQDPQVLARAIETTLRGAGDTRGLTVTVAPDDAEWLEAEAGLRERLGIETVVADRRVERGGCLIAAGGREWNATVGGQLETLGEVVEEWLATAGDAPGGKEPLESPVG